jgi:hypothetical protein
MPLLPPHIAALADELRAELAADGAHERMLVEEAVAAAVRLRLLHEDPRLYIPHTVDRSWDRDHDLASRAYQRAYNALRAHRSSASSRAHGKRPSSSPRPLHPLGSIPTPRPAGPPASSPRLNQPVPPPPGPSVLPETGIETPAPRPSAPAPAPGRSPRPESGISDPESPRPLLSASLPPSQTPRLEPKPRPQPKPNRHGKAAPRRHFRRPPEVLPIPVAPRASPS